MKDYNNLYDQDFDLANHGKFKKDIASRLSHKKPYEAIERDKDKQLDILIVVDQMLTGFDSKWVNTLYLDKLLKYENVIQAFSRTNRLFGPDKPFGVIRYYRYPNTMERNIEEAVKYYSGDRKLDLFVERLPYNLKKLNELAEDMEYLFERAGVKNFEKLPKDSAEKGEFARLFSEYNTYLEAAKVQGFSWEKDSYSFADEVIKTNMEERIYLVLVQRYKELSKEVDDKGNGEGSLPLDIDGYLTEIDTDRIDSDYMNSRFDKYLKDLQQENIEPRKLQETLNELHKSFASLSQEEQKHANIFLHDVERGDVEIIEGKTFRDYITEYQQSAKNKQIMDLHEAIGVDVNLLEKFLQSEITEKNINEFGRFSDLEKTVDKEKAKKHLEEIEGKEVPMFIVNRDISKLLREFLLSGGFDIYGDNDESIYEDNKIDSTVDLSDLGMVAEENEIE